MTEPIEKIEKQSIPEQPVDNSAQAVDKSEEQQGSKVIPTKKRKGGARPGAGRKPGKLSQKTIEKLAIKKQFEDRVARHADDLFQAQITLAKGAQYLFVRRRQKTAKGWRWSRLERVEDPEIMIDYLDGKFKDSKDEYYMITADKPDSHAIDSLLDRAFGKAPQNLNIKDERPDPIATILARFGLLDQERDSKNAGQAEGTS